MQAAGNAVTGLPWRLVGSHRVLALCCEPWTVGL